jgi:aspartyl-tRNA(Asn)/glutamyl-tRNA(Gln) amidotransferase subunit B
MVWSAPKGWDAVIGLEVHAQLSTESKLFSSAPHRFGGEPNTQTTEVDLGMPGVLPVLNERAVELAVRAALALGCELHPLSIFARKHYFYPDLPKGYQISQYEEPFATGGGVPIECGGQSRVVPLIRIHMEEDAGKSIHDPAVTGGGVTHVDLNRAGVPLVEIVSQPELHSPEEASAYLRSLRAILRWVEACDGDMEKGNFRCDANVSVRRTGESKLGTRTELKNLNSFRFVERAIGHEIERQIDLLESGRRVLQETRTWDDRAGRSSALRSKEEAEDYRYFPEPDLPPLRLPPELVAQIREGLPELPAERRARWVRELGLSEADAAQLGEERALADFFEQTVGHGADARSTANWIKRSVLEVLGERGIELRALPFGPEQLAALVQLVDSGRVTAASGRQIFAELAERGGDPAEIMRARGLEALADTGELEALAREVVERNPAQLAQYRAGDARLFNYFVGQIMKATRGKANPQAVQQVLRGLLGSE